jgi:hypothetical protein
LGDVCTGGNPREVTYEDILKLCEIATKNKEGLLQINKK